jgi:hypothetical protein
MVKCLTCSVVPASEFEGFWFVRRLSGKASALSLAG